MNPFRALSDIEVCDLILDHLVSYARSHPEALEAGDAGARIAALRDAVTNGTPREIRQAGVRACAGVTNLDNELADLDSQTAYQGAREVIIRYCPPRRPGSFPAPPSRPTHPGPAT